MFTLCDVNGPAFDLNARTPALGRCRRKPPAKERCGAPSSTSPGPPSPATRARRRGATTPSRRGVSQPSSSRAPAAGPGGGRAACGGGARGCEGVAAGVFINRLPASSAGAPARGPTARPERPERRTREGARPAATNSNGRVAGAGGEMPFAGAGTGRLLRCRRRDPPVPPPGSG